MNYETITCDGLELVGLETRASNADPASIGALWGRFFGDPGVQQVDALDDAVVAVYCEYEGDHTQPYTFFLGRRVAPEAAVPEGCVRRRVGRGSFARFIAEGEQPAALIETWQAIWTTPIERRYEADYEIHAGGPRVEIFVGIALPSE